MKKTTDLKTFMADGEDFARKVLLNLAQAGLEIGDYAVDHLCFRVGTEEEYLQYKEFLLEHALLLTEAPINGRAISTFKLSHGFKLGNNTVNLVELPAPKKGSSYTTGFEHLEIVIRESFESFQARYADLQFESVNNKTLNPELCLKFDGFQVKFHHNSLERVIEMEQANLRFANK